MSTTGQVATLNGGAFARPSTATYLDAGGNLITVGVDVLRPNYSGGIATGALIEGFATNIVTNPRGEGAVVGTLGSGGAYPTSWNNDASAGLSTQIIGSGYVNGIPYVDIRFVGTSSGTTYHVDRFATAVAASAGQIWTTSLWLSVVGGSTANITSFELVQQTNNNSYSTSISTPNATLTRYQGANTMLASTTQVDPAFQFDMPLSSAIDITLRMAAPQLELGSAATSIILPPVGSPAVTTRAADTIGFARPSTANYFDYTGTLTSAVANFLRPAYDATGNQTGDLLEAAATNSIRNNTMVGAVAGSPGTVPANWTSWGTQHGLTQTVVGTGTESGISYIDVRFNGTTSGASFLSPAFETATGIPAVNGQTWSLSVYFKLVGGTWTNITDFQIAYQQLDNTQGGLGSFQSGTLPFPTSAGLATQRQSLTATNNQAATASVYPTWLAVFNAGVAVDFTLRIGMPQMELGSAATSIITTSGSTVTRAADTFTALGIPLVMEQLTGVAGTGQVGSITVQRSASVTLTGVSATGQVGTLTAQDQKTISGVSGTGQVGTLTTETDDSASLTGVAGTGQVGTLHSEIDKPLSGVAGTGQVGTLHSEIDKPLSGVAGTGQVGTLTTETDDTLTLTGVAGTGQVDPLKTEIDASIPGVAGSGQVGTLVAGGIAAISGVTANTSIAALSGGTFSRASIATYLDAGNVNLVTVGNDILRPSYVGGVLKGALIEAAATNIVTNNTGTGLIPGTPGTPPTNWTVTVGNGMSVQTVGSGVENGIAYVDIRWFGTAAGPASLAVVFDTTLTTTAGQTSTISLFVRTLPGSVIAVSTWTLDLTGATGAHLLTVGAPGSGGLPSQRFSVSGTAPSSGSITPKFALSSANGTTNDLTIRLGLPQVELGSSATSPIATSSGAVTRAADTVSSGGIILEMKPVTGVAGIGRAGTLVSEIDVSALGVAATGQVGDLSIEIDESPTLTGVAASGQVGTLATSGDQNISITGVAASGQVGTLTVTGGGELAQPVTGSGDDARRKYLDWKKQQKQQKRDKAKLAPTPAPRTQPIEPKPPKPLAVSSELAAQLLAQNLANQRAQLQRDIGDIFSEEQQAWANDEDEAMALLLLETVI